MALRDTYRRSSNRMIKWGYRTHGAGKKTRRAGLAAVGAAALGQGIHSGATYFSTGGRKTGVDPQASEFISRAYHRSGISEVPFVKLASQGFEQHVAPRARKAALGVFLNRPKLSKALGRVATATSSLPRVAGGAAKIGLGAMAVGYGLQKAGGWMLQRGYGSHPGTIRKALRRRAGEFFGAGVL